MKPDDPDLKIEPVDLRVLEANIPDIQRLCNNINMLIHRRHKLLIAVKVAENNITVAKDTVIDAKLNLEAVQNECIDIKKTLERLNKELEEAGNKLQQYSYHE